VTCAAVEVRLSVLILATRTRLVRQLSERLSAFGVQHGIIAASLQNRTYSAPMVQIVSADTLHRRCIVDERRPLPAADVVIFDEAHLAVAESRLRILQRYPQALHVGFTATPARKSGRSLSAAFDHLILGPSMLGLIRAKLLVRPRIFNTPIVTVAELKALPKDAASDYATGALGELLRRPKLVGDVVQNWLRIAAGKRTLVFAVNKGHGAQLAEEFSRAGVAAELITDQDEEDAREAAIARLEGGQTQVLVNCFLLSYGIDVPSVECIVLARPTRSLSMYLQMVGRGLRAAPGKDHCLLIDHGRVVETLGLPTADFGWSLDGRRNVNREATSAQRRAGSAERPRTCPECSHLWLVSEDGRTCPQCGWAHAPRARPVVVESAELAELIEDGAAVTPVSPAVVRFFREAIGEEAARRPEKWLAEQNRVRAACWHAAREKFRLPDGRAPAMYWQFEPLAPSREVSGYLHYRRIKFARSKGRAA
jgi:superfamily II DNA or RNA helicase